MIIKRGDQYHYLLNASPFTQRVLTWSPGPFEGKDINPWFSICLALSFLLGLPVFIAGVGCYINVGGTDNLWFALVGGIMLSPWIMAGVRHALRAMVMRRGALDRSRAVSFRKEYGRYVSNSYAICQMSRTANGTMWLDALVSCSISSSRDLAKYRRRIIVNPDEELFPKLKVHWDGYLGSTMMHDKELDAYGTKAWAEAQRLRNEVNHEARRVSIIMKGVKDERDARIAGIKSTLAAGAAMEARIVLNGVAPIYR